MRNLTQAQVTGVVLCGGKGSRLEGEDKPLLTLNHSRMIDYTCASLQRQVAEIVISCSRNVGIYEAMGHRMAIDKEWDLGPLAGITEAFRVIETEWALTTPGDTPFIADDLVDRLSEAAVNQGVAVPCIGGATQNLCMLISRERRKALTRFHEDGGNAVKYWLQQEGIVPTVLDDIADTFFNINTQAELAEARVRAGAQTT